MEPASGKNSYHYNPRLRIRAEKLRKNMTKSEVVLWKHALRKGLAHGFSFNRQRPVLDFIADFMCRPLLLIIEVDGVSHQFSDTIESDVVRQRRLEEVGFQVLRIPSITVLKEIKKSTRIVHDTVILRAKELNIDVKS